ncbi:MAG: DedA family protein [Desulfobacterales bacterium]|nr:DedA family protein [Desulfobacterales bacterium]
MEFIKLILHFDQYLHIFFNQYGIWIYGLLFLIIFCETGFVVTPFLPGDSLLFAAGALASEKMMNINYLYGLLVIAAILGDTVNYWVGWWVGPKVFHYEKSRWLNKKYLERAHLFYQKHGGKAIILARFVPIIRTFAPFVAGIATMNYAKFLLYNITGGVAWITLFLLGGYFLGNLPIVKQNFNIFIMVIIIVSVLPIVYEWWKFRKEEKTD